MSPLLTPGGVEKAPRLNVFTKRSPTTATTLALGPDCNCTSSSHRAACPLAAALLGQEALKSTKDSFTVVAFPTEN